MTTHVGVYGIEDDGARYSPKGNTHDHSISFITEDDIQSIELERYSRIKHDNRISNHIVRLLENNVKDLTNIKVTSVNSFLGSEIRSDDDRFILQPTNLKISDISKITECTFNGNSVDAVIMCHEFAHIASCLPFTDLFQDNSLLVHIDGGASKSASSAWVWENDRPVLKKSSWDELKDSTNNYNVNPLAQAILGLTMDDHLNMPGKLMGYASYGHYNPNLEKWLRSNRWFIGINDREQLLSEINYFFKTNFDSFNMHAQEFMDVAYAIQHGFETDILQYLSDLKYSTGCNRLYYAGGAALNIHTNSRIVNESGFEDVFIPPCAGDSGLSLGAAAWSYYLETGTAIKTSPFIGMRQSYIPNTSIDKIADDIINGKTVGLFTGRSEIGPRALGHRAIIARPDDIKLRIKISEDLKQREWYRPVAPVMIDQVAKVILSDYYENDHLARYMLGSYHVKDEYKDKLSGILHVDGTVRAQVVSNPCEPVYGILKELYNKEGIIAMMLTSFNSRGEPIVESELDAINCGKKINLDEVAFI